MSNILVTGAHGPLGNEMQRLAEQDAENSYGFYRCGRAGYYGFGRYP